MKTRIRMKLLTWTVLGASLFAFPMALATHAASAVVFCKSTQVYAYCYNHKTVSEAENAARKSALRRGAKDPKVIVSTGRPGYGAISFRRLPGKPIDAIGACVGAPSAREAALSAQKACTDVGRGPGGFPRVAWHDVVEADD